MSANFFKCKEERERFSELIASTKKEKMNSISLTEVK